MKPLDRARGDQHDRGHRPPHLPVRPRRQPGAPQPALRARASPIPTSPRTRSRPRRRGALPTARRPRSSSPRRPIPTRWSIRPSSTSPGQPRATRKLLPHADLRRRQRDFLTWPAGTPLPAILIKDHKGDEGPVNFAVRGETIVVDGVPREIVLRSGEDSATLTNQRAGPRAPVRSNAALAQAGAGQRGGEVMKLAMRLPEKGQRAANDGDPRDERDRRGDRPRQPHRLPGGRPAQGPLGRARARRRRRLRRAARRGDAVGPQRLAHGRGAAARPPRRSRAPAPVIPPAAAPSEQVAAGQRRARRAAADPAPSPVLAAPPTVARDARRQSLCLADGGVRRQRAAAAGRRGRRGQRGRPGRPAAAGNRPSDFASRIGGVGGGAGHRAQRRRSRRPRSPRAR